MSPSEHAPGSHPSGVKRRLKVANACLTCRVKKIKCDGAAPACNNCQKKPTLRENCTYSRSVTLRSGLVPRPILCHTSSPGSTRSPSHFTPISPAPARPESSSDAKIHWDGPIAGFADEVNSAIDARLGLPPASKLSLMPMLNAPLFGPLPLHKIADSSAHHLDHVLPPRKQADRLFDLYWRHVDPVEPMLDRPSFSQTYLALFSGATVGADETIFLSTLNVVFALSAQLEEHVPAAEREEASRTYFGRAWALLPPASVLWSHGTYDLVQCLMLMSRYLQCTNSPHQTWMAIGSAVGIAQSLGLHVPDTSPAGSNGHNKHRKRQIWQGCILLHRAISWSLGRTPVASPIVEAEFLSDEGLGGVYNAPYQQYLTKCMEVYEITNHIMLSQTSMHTSFADKFGLPRLHQNEEYCALSMKLENCLNKWHQTLPQSLTLDATWESSISLSNPRALMIHLRYLHGKILLFRPMVARLCLSSLHQAAAGKTASHEGMKGRMLKESASVCLETAQEMIRLIHAAHKPEATAGLIPWWHRVFYLHTATTILIAALFRADLFSDIVSPHWSRTMAALRAHEHLNPFFQQCVAAFEMLYSKILEMHQPDGRLATLQEGTSSVYFQDIFQDFGIEKDDFLLGFEDPAWLTNFTTD
ncbi:putative fungal-specific transcription factor [Thozetella sp. PMI_491]|nr:putative fungal-specific transcription factor [Thozetella sp. PMI_491]